METLLRSCWVSATREGRKLFLGTSLISSIPGSVPVGWEWSCAQTPPSHEGNGSGDH